MPNMTKKTRRTKPTDKPRKSAFDVAMCTGREQREGYVLGNFATHKDRYFWTFTYLPTGTALNTYPVHETKASALAHLAILHRDGLPKIYAEIVEKCGGKWGLGLA